MKATLAQQPRRRVGDGVDHVLQEAGGGSSIDDAMIEREAQRQLMSSGDLAIVEHDRFAANRPQSENARLGKVDDRREGVDAERAQIRDREDATLHLGGDELPSASLIGESS